MKSSGLPIFPGHLRSCLHMAILTLLRRSRDSSLLLEKTHPLEHRDVYAHRFRVFQETSVVAFPSQWGEPAGIYEMIGYSGRVKNPWACDILGSLLSGGRFS